MNIIYNIIETILPFDFMKFDFMKNALIAILLVTPLFAILGTMVVNNKMAFFADGLGHSAITGVAIGALLGMGDPKLSLIGFAVIFALVLSWLKSKNKASSDTIISVISSTSLALGLVILSRNGGFAHYSTYLIGDVLSISHDEIAMLFILFVIVFVVWCLIYNKLLIISVNPSIAKSKNIKVRLIENIFLVLVAVVVAFSIKWVGVLIINSLIIIPVAAARNIAKNMRAYQIWAVVISMFSGITGLISSYYLNTGVGAATVLVSAGVFFITVLLKK